MVSHIEKSRREVARKLRPDTRSTLGQFMTPQTIADFMASLFGLTIHSAEAQILDAGAGVGSLSIALLNRIHRESPDIQKIKLHAYEIDPLLAGLLKQHLSVCTERFAATGQALEATIIEEDFIESAVIQLYAANFPRFDYAILNPPYRKINSASRHRKLLRTAGIETVNLYSAFLSLSILAARPQGEIVAIIPRSFCNGPYYKSFREMMLRHMSIRRIHLFESRSKAFGEDDVLQENIILHLKKEPQQPLVSLSTSTDGTFADYHMVTVPFEHIVKSEDREKFIHIPTAGKEDSAGLMNLFTHTLASLNIGVSTGPVVDFRVSQYLRKHPEAGAVPLLYPGHFGNTHISWPKEGFKKYNAIASAPETEKQLYPSGYYTLVKRFSAKEEKKRIVACVFNPGHIPAQWIGIENHLNVFHCKKEGLPEKIAYGLSVYLNSSAVDNYFRKFNGHTQVNATDLRGLGYPSTDQLEILGEWAKSLPHITQEAIDHKILSLCSEH
ncbi:MAG: SAM-dependent methyltransferase [Bacteroidetes bacterium]|nr:MAG: SAM-dependent methyltransferase [Bacteroidota bacterium]